MSNEEIKLPPLPPKAQSAFPNGWHDLYTEHQMNDHARAAILADRAARPVADAGEAVLQVRSPEGDPWQEVTADQFYRAIANGYETRTLYRAAPSARALPSREKLDELWAETGNLPVGDAERLRAFAIAAIFQATSAPAESPSAQSSLSAASKQAQSSDAPSVDVLYAAWHKVGADVAGLKFEDFVRALQGKPEAPKGEAS